MPDVEGESMAPNLSQETKELVSQNLKLNAKLKSYRKILTERISLQGRPKEVE